MLGAVSEQAINWAIFWKKAESVSTILELQKLLTIQSNVIMPAYGTTPEVQEDVVQASKTWFPSSQLFYSNFISDDSIKEEEFSLFAKIFRPEL